mgnify:CR=1 FL=1
MTATPHCGHTEGIPAAACHPAIARRRTEAKPSISVPLKSTASALAGILLIPLLLPAVPFVLFSVSSFGGVTASVSGQSSYTLSLFNVASVTQYAWALWICFVLFIIATIYIALRETARNMYDPYYAKWENTWKLLSP